MNELLFITATFLDLSFILLLFRLQGYRALFASVVLNIILVSLFGSKLISIWGFTSNATNVFYACVFFAANIIAEHYGKKQANSLIIDTLALYLFTIVMGQFALYFVPVGQSDSVQHAM